tara:strand:+ start:132 stop:1373 length:1242 start_codon:yes stop_codon:yes gene_type:complete
MIVSYTFPPSTDVGGRRWSKFIHYLKDLDYNITLLTRKPKEEKKLVKAHKYLHRVEFFKDKYPKALEKEPKNILDRLIYKASILFLMLITKSNYYDKGILIKRHFIKKASILILEENINLIIVSGAPFSLLYYSTFLKKKFSIKLISDFRDPWTWGSGYGMTLLTRARLKNEEFFQKKVIEVSDLITVPVKPMHDFLVSNYIDHKFKIKILPHAYDINDFEKINFKKRKRNEIFKIVYGGTIYSNLDKTFKMMYQTIKDNHNNFFEIEFFTNDIKYLNKSEIEQVSSKLKIRKKLPINDFMLKLYFADAFLLLFPDDVKDFISSKFYEIIYLRKPIIYIGSKGLVSEFIVSNKLGIHILPEMLHVSFDEILKKGSIEDFNYNYEFDVSEFSFKFLTSKLNKWIIELYNNNEKK